jgi:hypothetical protein
MPYKAHMELVGIRETIRALNKVEPGLRKQFVNEARRIAEPAIQRVQAQYTEVPLSGMKRVWVEEKSGRKIYPFYVLKAKRGVQLKVDTGREAKSIITIVQNDPGTAIFETAGRKTNNSLGRSLGYVGPGRTRIIGPAVYRSRHLIEREMATAIDKAMKRVQKELN